MSLIVTLKKLQDHTYAHTCLDLFYIQLFTTFVIEMHFRIQDIVWILGLKKKSLSVDIFSFIAGRKDNK